MKHPRCEGEKPAPRQIQLSKELWQGIVQPGRFSHHAFGPNSDRGHLGNKTKRVCRYCGLAAPQIKFKKLAHAIPDQFGTA